MTRPAPLMLLSGFTGAVLGVVLTLSLAASPATPRAPASLAPDDLRDALGSALRPLVEETSRGFANLRSDLRSGYALPARADAIPDRPADQDSPPGNAHATLPPVAQSPGRGLPPPRPEAFEALRNWKTDPMVRRTWLFAPEADVLYHFGTPDHIGYAGLQETWSWNKPEGGTFSLAINKGRVVLFMD